MALKLAGTGPEEAALRELAGRLGSSAEFLGFRSGADLHALIRGARAVVLPSEWYENAPMSVLESFALGKPVIGADIGGIPEMVEHGHTGWTFPSRDVAALGDTLASVAGMPTDELRRIGEHARAFVQERFNRAGYVASTLQLYADLGVRA